jgi:hypothetical protein
VLSETWSALRDQLTLEVSGEAGGQYRLGVWNPREIESVDGAILNPSAKEGAIEIHLPQNDSGAYAHADVVIHFSTGQKKGKTGKH